MFATSASRTLLSTVLLVFGLSAPASATWNSDPALNFSLADGVSDQTQPKLVPVGDGRTWMSWFDGGGTGYDVRVQLIAADGTELLAHNGELVADRSFSSTQDYGLSVMSTGDALLTFRDDRPGGTQITAARIAPNGASLWGPNGVTLTATTDFVAAPAIAGTIDGDIVVAWTQETSIHLQRLDSAGTPTWANDVVFTPTEGSYSVADMHAAGTDVIVSFVHQIGGFGSPRHILAQKIDDTGTSQWGAGHVAVFDGGSLQFGNFPDFVPDGSGGAVFSWYDTASTTLQCLVQRVNSGGTEIYPHNGVSVSTNASRQRVSPSAQFDEASGDVVVFWTELNLSQSQSGVYGQRIDNTGARLWGADGTMVVPIGSAAISLVRTVLLSTGGFVFWERSPAFGEDTLIGARLDVSGVIDIDPFFVSTAFSSKGRLAAVASDANQSVLVWSDERNDGGDIFGQNVNEDGSLGTGAASVSGGDVQGFEPFAVPNPTSGTVHIPLQRWESTPARLAHVYDATGTRVTQIRLDANTQEFEWDLLDERGLRVSAGLYYVKLDGDREHGSVHVTVLR